VLHQCPDPAQNNKKPCKCQGHLPMLHAINMPRSTSEYSTAMEMSSTSIEFACYTDALTQLKTIKTVPMSRAWTDSACHANVFKHLIVFKTMPLFDASTKSACHVIALAHVRICKNNGHARYICQFRLPFSCFEARHIIQKRMHMLSTSIKCAYHINAST
jgi:hypothetical protein